MEKVRTYLYVVSASEPARLLPRRHATAASVTIERESMMDSLFELGRGKREVLGLEKASLIDVVSRPSWLNVKAFT